MSYTYAISFNSSDYIEFTPVNFPEITVSKEEGDFVWLTDINEIKIGKSLSSSVYDTLETWYGDTTKHSLNIKVRIQKSAVTKWTFQFGVRQGMIDYELKTYEVTPTVIEPVSDIYYYKERTIAPATSSQYHYNDEDDSTPEEIYGSTAYKYEDAMTAAKNYLNTLSDNTYTIQSAFLWNDNYPDETSPGSNNYVSSDYNNLNYLAIGRNNSSYSTMSSESIKTWIDIPKVVECYWYCASDYTIHFEHVSWFNDQIADYQLDLTGSDYYDDARAFTFSTPEVYSVEDFINPTDNDEDDWDNVQIVYEPELVGFSNEKIETRSEYDTYLGSDFANLEKFMIVGHDELAIGYRATSGWSTFTTDGADVTTGVATASGHTADTNYVSTTGQTIIYDIDVTYSVEFPYSELELVPMLGGSPNGSAVTLNPGSNTGSLGSLADAVRIQSTGAQHFTYTMSLKITGRYRIPWETGVISGTSYPNCYMSWANNIDRFYQDNRYGQTGSMNGSDYNFNSVKRVREQKEFSFYYSGDIDPMRGIKTDYGIGMIQKYTRDLATDFITVTLRYE